MKKVSLRSWLLMAPLMLAPQINAKESGSWVNQGGMWMPEQILQQASLLKSLGLQIDPQNLSDPSSSTLQAVISLGFCSGSFVSPNGLIITNHHCVQGMLSHMSKEDASRGVDSDFVQTGFYAKALKDERTAGPAQRVYVTQKLDDVTSQVLAGLDGLDDYGKRGEVIEERVKSIVASAEASAENVRAEVRSFFRGEKFILIKKLEIKDVRVVYAPPSAVGFYGGDSDNWTWPRHTGDFAFLRAYVAPDGSSAEYSVDNVPYHPDNILPVARQGVDHGDLVLVAGYPGATNRLETAAELSESMNEKIPYLLGKYGEFRQMLGELSGEDDQLRKKLQSPIFSLDNFLKNRREALKALKEVDYLGEKQTFEAQLEEWLASRKKHQSLKDVLDEMEALRQKFHAGWQERDMLSDLYGNMAARSIHLIGSAVNMVRMAEERPKPDAQRHPDYQERNWQRLLQGEEEAQLKYDRRIGRRVLAWVLGSVVEHPRDKIPGIFKSMLDVEAAKADPQVIERFVDQLFAQTQMEDLAFRKKMLQEATSAELLASKDPVVQIAVALAPLVKEEEKRSKVVAGSYLDVIPRYMKAMRVFVASTGRLLAPDANSTLRITYGHVKGYQRLSNGKFQHPFTDVHSLARKHQAGHPEYEVPANVLEQIKHEDFGSYTDLNFGTVPVNFLAAVDTTGGNSGSPALNARGELIGLLFDGNQDALYSDWVFKDEQVRSILLDIRYALWILDKVDHASRLVSELGFSKP